MALPAVTAQPLAARRRDAARLLSLRNPKTCQQWIKRRVDTLEFADQAIILRAVRLDLNLADPQVDGLLVRRDGFILLPIARLPRYKHTPIAVEDESGAVLPRLNASEEREMALDAIQGLAHVALGEQLNSETLERIAEVLRRHRNPRTFDNRAGGQITRLAQNVGFMGVLYVLFANTYLVVFLPEDTPRRRVLTYRYEEHPNLRDADAAERRRSRELSAVGVVSRRSWDFLRHTVWPPTGVGVQADCANIEEAKSYHVNVRAPEDAEIHGATLCVPQGGLDLVAPGRYIDVLIHDDDQSLTRAHMFCPPPPRQLTDVRVEFQLAPLVSGMVRSSMLISVAIAAVLAAALVLAHTVSEKELFSRGDRSSVVAVLLLAPAILAALLAAPHRHGMTTRLHWETRLTIAVCCLAIYVAAGAVAVGVGSELLREVLLASLVVAGLGMVRLVVLSVRLGYCRRDTRENLNREVGREDPQPLPIEDDRPQLHGG